MVSSKNTEKEVIFLRDLQATSFFLKKKILESTSKKMIARVTLLYNPILF